MTMCDSKLGWRAAERGPGTGTVVPKSISLHSLPAVLMRHSQAQLKTWLEGVARKKSTLEPAIKLFANYVVGFFFFFL